MNNNSPQPCDHCQMTQYDPRLRVIINLIATKFREPSLPLRTGPPRRPDAIRALPPLQGQYRHKADPVAGNPSSRSLVVRLNQYRRANQAHGSRRRLSLRRNVHQELRRYLRPATRRVPPPPGGTPSAPPPRAVTHNFMCGNVTPASNLPSRHVRNQQLYAKDNDLPPPI